MTQDHPRPAEVARQLAIYRYVVTAPDQRTHDKLAAQAPWANWIEPAITAAVPGRKPAVSWLVAVFAADDGQFADVVAISDGVAARRVGDPSANGHGH